MKRLMDILFSLIALFFLFPALIFIAILIYLDDRGPALFLQTRVGKNGLPFKIYKFRTMVVNASIKGGYATADKDPRITSFGRVLRRTSIDELPQLINVLIGEMSLVGPRPDVLEQRSLYTEEEWIKRHNVRPGITGLSQAALRSQATIEERKSKDLYYVDNHSIMLDISILLKTVIQIIRIGGN